MELHTFSSLTEEFLQQYAGCMDNADIPIIFFNPEAVKHKKLPPISAEKILNSFQNKNLQVFDNSLNLKEKILSINSLNTVFLFMSSGNFDKINLINLTNKIISLRSK